MITKKDQAHQSSTIRRFLRSRLVPKPAVIEDPRLLSSREKGTILVCLALCASTPGFSSTIYFPGLPNITSDLNAPPIATTLTAALFVLFMGIAPVFWAAISDYYRVRRILLITSMFIFAIASLGSAFINNIWGLVVLRCVQSVGSSCGQSVGAGAIADCYPVERRGAAFGKFFFGVFIGPLLGPIIGGFLIMSNETWRATFWFCFAFGMFVTIVLFFVYPETYRDNKKFDAELPEHATKTEERPQSKVQASKAEEGDEVEQENRDPTALSAEDTINASATTAALEDSLKLNINSFQEKAIPKSEIPLTEKRKLNLIAPFLLLRHPFVFMAALVSGIAFGDMFAVETIIPGLYETNYHFSSWQTGLSYLGAGVGNMLGSMVGGFLSDRLLLRARRKRGGRSVVEDRLTVNLWPAGLIIIPFGLLLFGWMIDFHKSVWGGIVGFGFVTFGMNMLMTATSAYLVDAMPGVGASAAAAANLVRMVLACVLTLVSNPMVSALGPGWTSVLLAGLILLSVVVLFILKVKGEQLRKWSGVA